MYKISIIHSDPNLGEVMLRRRGQRQHVLLHLLGDLDLVAVFPDCVHPEGVASVASLVAQRALVTEPADVGLDMLLDRVPQLGAVVALGTLPHCFT